MVNKIIENQVATVYSIIRILVFIAREHIIVYASLNYRLCTFVAKSFK